jgi:hypothetical protein
MRWCRIDHAEPGDYTIAVNRAAICIRPDAIVAGDYRTLRDIAPCGAILWTMKNDGELPVKWAEYEVCRFDLLPGWTDLGRPANWSIQGAIAIAVYLRYRNIVIHCADSYFGACDTADCSGYDGPDADRTPERWRRERSDIDLSIAWAKSQGATVTMRKP